MKTNEVLFLGLVIVLVLGFGVSETRAASPYNPERLETLKTIPDTDPLAYLAALDHLQVGDTDEAVLKSERAVRAFPYHRPSFVLHVRLLSGDRGASFAREWARNHLRRTNSPALLDGLVESGTMEEKSLELLLLRAAKEGFSTPETLRYLGDRLTAADADSELVSVLEETLETADGTSPTMVYLRARLLLERGKCDRAVDVVRQLVRRAPGRADFQLLKARLLKKRKPEVAKVAYERYRSLLSDTQTVEPLDDHDRPCP